MKASHHILHAAFFTPMGGGRWGLPLLAEGEPGGGKTSMGEQYAARLVVSDGSTCPTKVLSPGKDGEAAFGAVPVPTKGGVIGYPRPDWTVPMDEGSEENPDGFGFVILDEVTTAPPIIQAPMLSLLTGGHIGSFRLGKRVRVIGLCNPPDVAAHGHELSAPLANRFVWLKWENPSVDQHIAYMLGTAGGSEDAPIDARAEEARVLAAWGEAFARAVGLETAFLSAQSDFKNKCPKAGSPKASRAWPSDRTWEYATRAYASALVHGLTETERDELVTGCVGAEAYEAFATFIEQADLPNVADVLDGKVSFKPHPSRLDKTAAVLNSATALVTPAGAARRKERTEALWKLLADVGAGSLDLVVPCAQALIQSNLHGFPVAVPLLAKVQPVIAAAQARR